MSAVRIDSSDGHGRTGALGVGRAPALEGRGEEADVGDQRIDVAIGRHDRSTGAARAAADVRAPRPAVSPGGAGRAGVCERRPVRWRRKSSARSASDDAAETAISGAPLRRWALLHPRSTMRDVE